MFYYWMSGYGELKNIPLYFLYQNFSWRGICSLLLNLNVFVFEEWATAEFSRGITDAERWNGCTTAFPGESGMYWVTSCVPTGAA